MLRHFDKHALLATRNPLSPVSEAYRSLCTQLQFIGNDVNVWTPRVMAVMSSGVGEGKTTTVTNMAITYAMEGKRVLLIDGDLRRSRLHRIFGMDMGRGLSHLLRGGHDAADIARETGVRNLSLITAGANDYNYGELLALSGFELFLERAREVYDVILFDSPPVLVVNDAKLIASCCDGVLLVVKAGVTKREALMKAKQQLERVQANILGVVLNEGEQLSKGEWRAYFKQVRRTARE
ncbi:CpsD/CapB family tyrosine-protein kinase [Paenibacillus sp. 481]|uniref:CpsD/CapB family tyrosine-protein kinase n=1 Tax=Paenibacillus sp. 481 TaxID=2835869 RepID=UPI001E64C153|nr:CpsD/CapB family tyrosine-protein kinase [Paenibacillus sp. 481]UHA71960.1 CpsD/CapB family tyrosine-protein kinase [Paenibacillus sp. 481]